MSKLENDAMIQLINNINEKKSGVNTKQKKKEIVSEKNCCIAAVKYNTIGNAYKDRVNNVNVYLVKEEKNGSMKTFAYARCSKTTQESNDYCHLHCRMIKHNNAGIKIFEKDVLPKDKSDKSRWLANINDDFFENMGKRGAKKKYSDNNFTFSDENNPILLVLNHKNAKLTTQMAVFASQLLKNTNSEDLKSNKLDNLMTFISSEKNKISKTTDNKKSVVESLPVVSSKEAPDEEASDEEASDEEASDKEASDEEASDEEASDEEASDEEASDEEASDEEASDEEASDEEASDKASDEASPEDPEDPEDEVSCTPIYTINKKLLWLNDINNIIYEPEGEDGGEEIGILTEISEEYCTIIHNKKSCTVLKKISIKKHGEIYCCVLTDSLFNKKLKLIGKRTKLKNNEYDFNIKI